MQKIIPKKELSSFIDGLIKKYNVVAPVMDGNTKFRKIESSSEVWLDKVTEVPAKMHFMPEGETLIEFKNGKAIELSGEIKKTVLFGLRKCDLNALQILDKVMYDPQYLSKRRNTILVGLFCDNPDDKCFCNSMELQDYYDLFFYPKDDYYYISVGSKMGEALVKGLREIMAEIKIPNPENTKVLNTKDIGKDYRNKIWEADADKCLSCAACTMVCPTCNCFDIKDSLDADLKNGKRCRHHASCQLKSFSKVAGGKSFRESRLSRFKHFVFHKIVYYRETKGRPMCVGCGRCLRVCPTRIDWVDTINKMKDISPKRKVKVVVKKKVVKAKATKKVKTKVDVKKKVAKKVKLAVKVKAKVIQKKMVKKSKSKVKKR